MRNVKSINHLGESFPRAVHDKARTPGHRGFGQALYRVSSWECYQGHGEGQTVPKL